MKLQRYSTILLTALSFVGCSKVEDFNSNPGNALQIESVGGVSQYALMQAQPASKAVIDGNTLPGSEAAAGIGVFVTAQDGSAYIGKTSGYSNVKYTYNGEKWSTTTPIYLSNTVGKLYGYFPYSENATELTKIPVASSLNGTDYLYATEQGVSFSNKSVNLQMNHALARLHLTIKKGDKYLSDCNLSKIVLKSKAIDASGTMDITTGTVTATKQSDVTGTVELTGSDAVTAAGIEKDILLVPADNSEGKKDLTLILTIDGVEAKVIFTGDKGLDIRSGIQCNATLTIEDTGIKVTGVGVGVWGEGGSQTVQVDGHTVTVKLSDDAGIADDVLTNVKVDGNNVIILASSFQGRGLICNVGDNAKCEKTITNDKYIFTISEISSDIEAVLGYDPIVTLTVSSDSYGSVWIGDDKNKTNGQFEQGEQVVIHATPNNNFRFFRWDDNNKESSRTITVGATDVTYSAKFISIDMIPGLFTVDSNGKQVFFSNGNLYCFGVKFNDDGTVKSMANAQWGFEANQYDTTPPSNGNRVENHISHFMWCRTPEKAMALEYDSNWDGETPFFAAKNFTVNGYSGWSVLTGGANGEWAYLLNTRKTIYGKDTDVENRRYAAVEVNGMAGLLLFPDDFSSWPSGAGTEPQTFNTNSSNWNNRNYAVAEFTVLQNNGCVFLPAAGYRNGTPGMPNPTRVDDVGRGGYYWSASPLGGGSAYDLSFSSGLVDPLHNDARLRARSVRLVTESK